MGYTRVTDTIGPKGPLTEVVLECVVSIPDYLKLDRIAKHRGQDEDDLLREIIHAYVTTTHDHVQTQNHGDDLS